MACYGTIQAGFAHWYIISFRGVGRSFFFPNLVRLVNLVL